MSDLDEIHRTELALALGWSGIHRERSSGNLVGCPPDLLTFMPVPLPDWSKLVEQVRNLRSKSTPLRLSPGELPS